jgi:hypothetical protein
VVGGGAVEKGDTPTRAKGERGAETARVAEEEEEKTEAARVPANEEVQTLTRGLITKEADNASNRAISPLPAPGEHKKVPRPVHTDLEPCAQCDGAGVFSPKKEKSAKQQRLQARQERALELAKSTGAAIFSHNERTGKIWKKGIGNHSGDD